MGRSAPTGTPRAFGRRSRGFTLVELMVTVAIVGILASIAWPSYQQSVMHGRRTDAIQSITYYRQALERCYSQNFTYVNAAATPCPAATGAAVASTNGYYTISFPLLNATQYTIQANPLGTQANDLQCQVMTVNQSGQTAAANGGGVNTTIACWGTN
ncbi:MAG TPA: type IV pilin protein [Steroidobacteraceae bacterium]|nr:type IV pilin protein [Steroidobacteraceae bacterium]